MTSFNAVGFYNVGSTNNFHGIVVSSRGRRFDYCESESDDDDSSTESDTDSILSENDLVDDNLLNPNSPSDFTDAAQSTSYDSAVDNQVLQGILVELKSTGAEETIKAVITCLGELLSISNSIAESTSSAFEEAVLAAQIDVEKAAKELLPLDLPGRNLSVNIEDPFRWLVMNIIEIISDYTSVERIEIDFQDSDHGLLDRASAQRLENTMKTFKEIWDSKRTSASAEIRRLQEEKEFKKKEQEKRKREEKKDHKLAVKLQEEEHRLHKAEQEAQALREKKRDQKRAERQRRPRQAVQVQTSHEVYTSPVATSSTATTNALGMQTQMRSPTNGGQYQFLTANSTVFNVSNCFNTRHYTTYYN